jgi:hypothetical protein
MSRRLCHALPVAGFVIITLVAPPTAVGQTTALLIDSQPGDWVGGGMTAVYSTVEATFSVVRTESAGLQIRVTGSSWSSSWTLLLRTAPPESGSGPLVGVYEAVRRGASGTFNGLDFSGAGRGCNQITGRVVVLEAVYGPGGGVSRFAADFEQHCEDSAPGLFGAIRLNSTITSLAPFGGAYPAYRLALAVPQNGHVTGEGLACGRGSVACQVSFTSATRITLEAEPDPGYFFAGWAGECLGGEVISVHVNSQKRCSARFLPLSPAGPRTLALISGSHSGRFSDANSVWDIAFSPVSNMLSLESKAVDTKSITSWRIQLTPPLGQVLQVGVEYTVPPSYVPGSANLFLAHDGVGWVGGPARFRITEWEQTGDAPPTRFAFDFNFEGDPARVIGGIVEYASSGVYGALDLNPTDVQFCVTVDDRGIVARSADQNIAITQHGAQPIAWLIKSNQPWLTAFPASGSGAAVVAIRVRPGTSLPSSTGATGRLDIIATASVTGSSTQVTVTLDVHPANPAADIAVFRPGSGTWYVSGQGPHQLGLPGDVPVPGDYDGDGTRDAAVYRPATGEWVYGSNAVQWGLPGDNAVPGDYNGDGRTDPAVFRTLFSAGACWWIRGENGCRALGMRGDVPVPADYDSDGVTDIAVYRPSNGTWYIVRSLTGMTAAQFGHLGDVPVPADFDADRKADLAVFRRATGEWFVLKSATNTMEIRQFGWPGDVPMPVDADSDGRADFRVWRPGTGVWFTASSFSGTFTAEQFGQPGDIPALARLHARTTVIGDFDGDGRGDVTVVRPSTGEWFTRQSHSDAVAYMQWGVPGDVRMPGDYDGDRRSDHAVYRPSSGEWLARLSGAGTLLYVVLGRLDDVPMAADYDGDGRTDVAIYRPATGEWQLALSSRNFTDVLVRQWGLPGDLPIAADFDGDRRADLAAYRPSSGTWYVRLSSEAFGPWIVKQWGRLDDVPIARDFDGDGRADLGVYRPSTGEWLAVDALEDRWAGTARWGVHGDEPVPLDYDGDGRADPSVFRLSTGHWYMFRSSDGHAYYIPWGLPGDRPIGGN